MPGMSDAHVHLVLNANTWPELLAESQSYLAANTLAEARRMLLRGFTTVRDMGGDTAGLQKLIDKGVFAGPRIYPSQAPISQTAGHGDLGYVYDLPTALGGSENRSEAIGAARIVDGPERVLAAAREQLKKGASQIKLMAGGGVASPHDHLYTLQFTPAELQAGVAAAENYGTYVAAHVYTVAGIRRSVEAGVKSIEHAHLADESTIAMLAERGVWLSTQPFVEADHYFPDPGRADKNRQMCCGVDQIYCWAIKHGVKVAFGTDLLFDPESAGKQNEMIVRLGNHYSTIDALRMVTSGNAELFRLSGERDPYRDARTGVIEAGAWADVLVVDGDPTVDLGVLKDPVRNLVLIVKDGVIHKNTL